MPSLRFVEINGTRKSSEILENLPSQIIGHKGEIKPQITNGHISRHHATVCYNENDESWLVIDGNTITGVESKNGLRDSQGHPIVGKTTLKDVGDRVYLLYMYDTNAYLEVFNTAREKLDGTSGLEDDDIEPEISKLSVNTHLLKDEVCTALKLAQTNKETLTTVSEKNVELSGKVATLMAVLDQGLNQVEEIGNKPKQFILGFGIFSLGVVSLIVLYGVFRNVDPIVRSFFDIQPHHEKQK